jgi:hypothetical protein
MAYTNLDTDLLQTCAIAVEAGNFGRAAALACSGLGLATRSALRSLTRPGWGSRGKIPQSHEFEDSTQNTLKPGQQAPTSRSKSCPTALGQVQEAVSAVGVQAVYETTT